MQRLPENLDAHMTMEPKISIIIPTFNRANYLKQAIESALAQEYVPLEVIISDNASTDGTFELSQRYLPDPRFRYCRNDKNIGMVPNWRKALYEYGTGDFFIVLSDDDYLTDPTYLTKAVHLIKSDRDVVLVYANGYISSEDRNVMTPLRLPFRGIEQGKTVFLSRGTIRPQDFTVCNVLFKRKLALDLKAFGNDSNICCDTELFLKTCLHGKIGIVYDFVSVYRIHATNLLHSSILDLNIQVNNLDALQEPFLMAKRMNSFSRRELDLFEKRALLPAIRRLLINVVTWHGQHYDQVLAVLRGKNAGSLSRAFHHPLFLVKFFIAKYTKFLLYCLSGSYRRKIGTKRGRRIEKIR